MLYINIFFCFFFVVGHSSTGTFWLMHSVKLFDLGKEISYWGSKLVNFLACINMFFLFFFYFLYFLHLSVYWKCNSNIQTFWFYNHGVVVEEVKDINVLAFFHINDVQIVEILLIISFSGREDSLSLFYLRYL